MDRWLQHKGLDVASLDDHELQLFLDALSAETQGPHPTAASFTFLLEYLRTVGATPWLAADKEPESLEETIIDGFGRYLRIERRLGTQSVTGYGKTAGSFMQWLERSAKTLQSMDASDVITFATSFYSAEQSLHAKKVLTGLRSFLRWAYLENLTERIWVEVVPSAASHGANLPKGFKQKEVNALLATCDRETVTGLRNYAMLVLMSRLGLRVSGHEKVPIRGQQESHDSMAVSGLVTRHSGAKISILHCLRGLTKNRLGDTATASLYGMGQEDALGPPIRAFPCHRRSSGRSGACGRSSTQWSPSDSRPA
ncbi:site-specific integrase [Arthrobacter sp. H35-D1]|uniref:site-specific integrase n=1 Tax=Arthrobacter sp. H35-D1 TaxID=3046202 RepID=UPI0024BBB3C1|nr:site-specific integrase [Arthrobacter sp. H35-D1]MDJ0313900.1 site-specific integrase [Arthrobacter sp. H35-D1]